MENTLLCQENVIKASDGFFYSSILYLVPKPVPIYMYRMDLGTRLSIHVVKSLGFPPTA